MKNGILSLFVLLLFTTTIVAQSQPFLDSNVSSKRKKNSNLSNQFSLNRRKYIYPEFVYHENQPDIDGFLDPIKNEWNINLTRITSGSFKFPYGYLSFKIDFARLYILFDILNDTYNDVYTGDNGDFLNLYFDFDRDGRITNGLDKRFVFKPGFSQFVTQNLINNESISLIEESTTSVIKRGFGCYLPDRSIKLYSIFPLNATCTQHQIYETALDFSDINAYGRKKLRFGFEYTSQNPTFSYSFPEDILNNYDKLLEIRYNSNVTYPPSGGQVIFQQVDPGQNSIEVTQAVQNKYNSLDLVQDKKTIARVFTEMTNPSNIFAPRPASTVVYLFGERGGTNITGSPIIKFHQSPLSADRSVIEKSTNFVLPKDWLNGEVTFWAMIRDFKGNVEKHQKFTIKFIETRAPVIYTLEINNNTIYNPMVPPNWSISEFEKQKDYFKSIFPSPPPKYYNFPWTVLGPCTGCQFSDVNLKLDQFYSFLFGLKYTGLFIGSNFPDKVYGHAWTGNGGEALTVSSGGLGVSASGSFNLRTFAHELNHNFDMKQVMTWGNHITDPGGHPTMGCDAPGPADMNWPVPPYDTVIARPSIQKYDVVGLDTSGNFTYIKGSFPDFAGYCWVPEKPYFWISGYRWEKYIDLFATTPYTPPYTKSTLSTSVIPVDAFSLTTILQINETTNAISGEINSMFKSKADPSMLMLGKGSSGNSSIRIYDKNDNLIDVFYFNSTFQLIDGGKYYKDYKTLIVPYNPDITKLSLFQGSKIMNTIQSSFITPSGVISNINTTTVWSGGLQKVSWSIKNFLEMNKTFSRILYSPDDGLSYVPLSSTIDSQETNTFLVDSSILRGSDFGVIRVEISDGFNSTYIDSVPFKVEPNLPKIKLDIPENLIFNDTEQIILKAKGTDFEGGLIDENMSYWSIDGKIQQKGYKFDRILTAGTHTITFSVYDYTGAKSEKSVLVKVTATPEYSELPISAATSTLSSSSSEGSSNSGLTTSKPIISPGFIVTTVFISMSVMSQYLKRKKY